MFGFESQQPNGINVFSSFTVRAEPDYAVVNFTVASLARHPKKSLEQTGTAAKAVRAVLTASNITNADTQLAHTELELASDGYGALRKLLGYRAAREFRILVRDLSNIEKLLVEIVDAGGQEISSVSYKTNRLVELREQARQGAVAAARKKASMYAEAAGVGLGPVLRLDDVNPDSLRNHGHGPDVDIEGNSDDKSGSGSILIAGAVRMSFAVVAP